MFSSSEIEEQPHSPSSISQHDSPKNDDEDEVDPQVEFCALSSRSLQRPSDHYIPPPRRSHIASRLLRDPWTTALTQFSKVTNYVLSPYEDGEGIIRNTLRDPLGYARHREENAHYGNRQEYNQEPISHPPPALPQIDCSIPQQRLPPLTEDEYQEKYIHSSRRHLLDRICKGGIASHSLRRKLWPIVLGITEKNDNLDWSQLKSLYNYYSNQWKTILPDQESRFTAYRERKSLIDRDVVRCDRTHFFYADSTGNLERLRHLLMTYIMYDFDTGYVQGMTDLAAPLLYVWDGDIPKAFWCFVQMMNLFKRNFELSQKTMSNQLKALLKLIRITDPVFAQYLRTNDSENCYFAFRWIICLFKREFMKRKTDDYDDVLIVWETIWSVHSLACYEESKEEPFVDQCLSPILAQIQKSQKWISAWDDSDYLFKTSSTESSTTSLTADGVTTVPFPMKGSTDSANGEVGGTTTVKNNSEPFDLYLNRSKEASITTIKSPDKSGDTDCDDDEVDRPGQWRQLKSPPPSAQEPPIGDLITTATSTIPTTTATITTTMLTSPTPINKTKSILIHPPPKPRPVLSSSPRPPGANIYSYALSPPVREMYLHSTGNDNSEFLLCSPSSAGSKGSKGSSIEEIKRLTPVGNHPGGAVPVASTNQQGKSEVHETISKQSDTSDDLKLYEFDQLAVESANNSNRTAKLENFELFCLCISLAIIRRERDIILIKKYEASEILKHFNTLTLNEYLDSILLHSMTIWHWLKHDGGEKSLYSDDEKPGNTSNDDFDLLNDADEVDCHFAALSV